MSFVNSESPWTNCLELYNCSPSVASYYWTLVGKHIWGVQWHHHVWPWVTFKGQIQGHSDFEALYLVKELGHILLWNKSAENCHLSHQLQVSSRAPRSMDLLFLFSLSRHLRKETLHLSVQKGNPCNIGWCQKSESCGAKVESCTANSIHVTRGQTN